MPLFRTRGKGKTRQVYPISEASNKPKLITTRLVDRKIEEKKAQEGEPVWLLVITGDDGYDYEFDSLDNAEKRERDLSKKGSTTTRILNEALMSHYVKVLDDKNLARLKKARREFKK